jgi:hypothetical protein
MFESLLRSAAATPPSDVIMVSARSKKILTEALKPSVWVIMSAFFRHGYTVNGLRP